MDRADARAELWRRYDAGDVSADDVEARLLLLDRAGDDEAALRRALDHRVPLHRRRTARRALLTGAVVGAALLVTTGAVAVIGGGDGESGGRDAVATTVFVDGGVGAVAVGAAPVPRPVEPPVADPACLELVDAAAADPNDELPASDALLSDPPTLPDGYELDDDRDIAPGFDDDLAMSTAASSPVPVEIRARELDGDLPVRMRLFRHDSPEGAREAGVNAARSACDFGGTRFEVPDRPEIGGFVVSGPIPTTAFAGWVLGDRRFLVAVESEGEGDDEIAEAQGLAGAIAAGELDAARG